MQDWLACLTREGSYASDIANICCPDMACQAAKSASRRRAIKAFYQIIGPLYLIGAFLATGTTTASDFSRLSSSMRSAK